LLAHLPRAFWVCLVNYPIATCGSILLARTLAEWLNLDPVDAITGWCVSALLASSVWYALEPWVQRLWGARPLGERESLRLTSTLAGASSAADPTVTRFLVEEASRVAVRTGLRTLVVSSGALQQLNDHKLGRLLSHGLLHLNGKSATLYFRCGKACMPL
jgi:hypothetical protein